MHKVPLIAILLALLLVPMLAIAQNAVIYVTPQQDYTIQADVGRAITLHFTVGGGAPPYKYSWYLQGPGQSGLFYMPGCLDNSSVCTFTPTTVGAYDISFDVSDTQGDTGSAAIEVYANPTLTASVTPSSSTVSVGNSTYAELIPQNGASPYNYTWTVTSNTFACPIPSTSSIGNVQVAVFTPSPSEVGCVYSFLGNVTDSANESATGTSTITVIALKGRGSAPSNTPAVNITNSTESNPSNSTNAANTTSESNTTTTAYVTSVVSANSTAQEGVDILGFGNGSISTTVGGIGFEVVYLNAYAGYANVLIDDTPYELRSGTSVPLNISYQEYYVELLNTTQVGNSTVISLDLYKKLQQNQTPSTNSSSATGIGSGGNANSGTRSSGPGLVQYLFYMTLFLIVIGAIILILHLTKGRGRKEQPYPAPVQSQQISGQ